MNYRPQGPKPFLNVLLTYLATLQDEQMQELKNQTAILVKLEELSSEK
ncbi:hypothetical protein SBF1_1230006 [Candidatus Desulfosporosinus infrequens]|uniref:Uncharacterized protein n=1 Tax=Candidatus Desulfosporosinus infrequens TaxID=2043169 RepID=A0A2U3K1U0_9FIRM|nr:hypothetical protein SBF1_1230006 [Candidatus Desulfosporosinus infrequens]